MLKRVIALAALMLSSGTVLAQDAHKLAGTWKLLAFDVELQATGEIRPIYGKNPTGYAIFHPDGRMMTVIAGDNRKPAETDAERGVLLRTMIAYTGMYRVEGDKFTTKVDVSWNHTWTGTDQVRSYKLEGDRMQILSAWAPAANIPERPIARGILTWERVK